MITTCTLITNLAYASIDPVRVNVAALLIEANPRGRGRGVGWDFKLRGFGPDRSWPVFDMVLKTDRHTLIPDDQLEIDGHAPIALWRNNPHASICVDHFQGDETQGVYGRVWAVLDARVDSFERTPNVPRLSFVPRGTPRGRGYL